MPFLDALTAADLILLLLFACAFVLGFVQGAIRQLLGVGAWLLAFLVGAHLSIPLADYLSTQWTQFAPGYTDMVAFALISLVVFVVANIAIELTYKRVFIVSGFVAADELLGAFLAVGLAILLLVAVVTVLDTYYLVARSAGASEVDWLSQLYEALDGSSIVGWLRSSLLPGLEALLGPLLPAFVRDAILAGRP